MKKNSQTHYEIQRPASNVLRLTFHFLIFLLLPSFLLLSSCQKTEKPTVVYPSPDTVTICFEHTVSGNPMITDSLIYTTSLGYHYMVNDLQYFISDLAFHYTNGNEIFVTDNDSIHYTDIGIPTSLKWNIIKSHLRTGYCDSVSFIFGLSEKKNRSKRFLNPPERDMFWPEFLGGGYHYMKLNLKYKSDTMMMLMPFMFHMGIGQIYNGTSTNADSITGYVQNYFKVRLPLSGFKFEEGKKKTLTIRMNIEKWFDGTETFDFSKYAMGIMQNEEGMSKAARNGENVFSIQ
ncbi:MAG: hypothetical protein Q8867_00130 [Bacteroidota bacterium]|nr:hypothetical protein [Bacteroidota bacterium]